MKTYTIKEVVTGAEFENKKFGGVLVPYMLTLEDENGGREQAGVNQKPTSVPPRVGDRVVGTIDATTYGPRFKKDLEATKALAYNAPQSSVSPMSHVGGVKTPTTQQATDWERKDDKIVWQSSTNAAAALLHGTGDIEALRKFRDTLFADYNEQFHPKKTELDETEIPS